MKKILLVSVLALFAISCGSDDSGTSDLPCDVPIVDIYSIKSSSAFVEWNQIDATSATLEYGPTGFSLGTGTTVTSSQSFDVTGLTPDTTYEVYVSVVCGNGGTSVHAGPFVFTTDPCSPVGIDIFNIEPTEITVEFGNVNNETVGYEYGLAGFQIGSGTLGISTNGVAQITGLNAGTLYDIYASRVCGTITSALTQASFSTASLCLAPESFSGNASSIPGRVNLFWDPGNNSAFRIEYGLSGFQLGTGQEVNTSSSSATIEGLSSGQTYEFYVQTNCGSVGFSSFVGPLPLIPN